MLGIAAGVPGIKTQLPVPPVMVIPPVVAAKAARLPIEIFLIAEAERISQDILRKEFLAMSEGSPLRSLPVKKAHSDESEPFLNK